MISLFKVFMSENVKDNINDTLMSGYITQGNKVDHFEGLLKDYIGNENLLTLNSATAGLTLALRLLKKRDDTFNWPGFNEEEDIVLSPALTCFATTSSIIANNCKLRWLDVDLNTGNICLKDLKNKLNEKTKVIYLVHWGGNPIDLNEIDKICCEHQEEYGFKPMVIEDCAHSFGAEYNGVKIGNHGNICVFSLQAIKLLTTGDGGFITLPNKQLYDRCSLLRWYGIDRDKRNYKGKDFRLENDIVESGYKFHMNDINATIGIHNYPHIDGLLEKNRYNAKYFNEKIKGIEGIQIMNMNDKSSYWLYSIKILNGNKQEFMDKMNDAKIMVSQVHNRNDINSCVKEFEEILPNLDILEKELVCIPVVRCGRFRIYN